MSEGLLLFYALGLFVCVMAAIPILAGGYTYTWPEVVGLTVLWPLALTGVVIFGVTFGVYRLATRAQKAFDEYEAEE